MHTKEKPQLKGDFIKSYDKVLSFLLKQFHTKMFNSCPCFWSVDTLNPTFCSLSLVTPAFHYDLLPHKNCYSSILSHHLSPYIRRDCPISRNLMQICQFLVHSLKNHVVIVSGIHLLIDIALMVLFFSPIDSIRIRPQEFSLVLIIFLLL